MTWSIVNIKCHSYSAGVQHRAGGVPELPGAPLHGLFMADQRLSVHERLSVIRNGLSNRRIITGAGVSAETEYPTPRAEGDS